MGAQQFFETEEGRTREEAFSKLVSFAIEQWGNDGYNGTISTTELVGDTVVIAKKFSQTAVEKARDYAEDDSYGDKWESRCLDLGVSSYVIKEIKKTRVEDEVRHPVYQTRYILCLSEYSNKPANNKTYKSEKMAENAAIKLAADTGFSVSIRKREVLVSGDDTIEKISVSSKTCKARPKNLPAGATVEAFHTYAFYGWASC